ncbi:DUF257 family protein [Thermococcus sp. LS2]|uniref:DUF257 family protein n=1 Tax=Thermococcus sp. LS2 TaxID=1638260 RepID=UPI00143B8DE2|nr:DUF257 family protein [Thermococcus sp. LS2]NJE12926.1 hypothetical protein [Thermococcus sp. LS2]
MLKENVVTFEELIKKTIRGPKASVLIKYSSNQYPGHILYRILTTLKKQYNDRIGYILVDILDTLATMKYQADAFGVNLGEALNGVNVLKVGGITNTGEVKQKIDLSLQYGIHREKYEHAMTPIIEELSDKLAIIKITVGLEKLLNIFDQREKFLQIRDIVRGMTEEERDIRNIFLINKNLWDNLEPYVSEYFEEAVLFIGELATIKHLKILKTIYDEFQDENIEF